MRVSRWTSVREADGRTDNPSERVCFLSTLFDSRVGSSCVAWLAARGHPRPLRQGSPGTRPLAPNLVHPLPGQLPLGAARRLCR